MRKLVSFLTMAIALHAGAGETWRWKDANGIVHYSDRPAPGAERIDIRPSRSGEPAASTAPNLNRNSSQPEEPGMPYSRCAIETPTNDQVFNAVNSVGAAVDLVPRLQEGHQIQVMLSGRAYPQWPATSTVYSLTDLYRGSYTLVARVLDGSGKPVCIGMPVTFHVRQPSVLAPARPAAARPPARP